MFIFYIVYTKHQVLLICNKNKEICIANLMKKYRDLFLLKIKNLGLRSEWVKTQRDNKVDSRFTIHSATSDKLVEAHFRIAWWEKINISRSRILH